MSPKNQRRLILDINYIRANALSVPDYQIMAVQDMIKNEDETLTDGTKFFLNVLNLALEDKNKFEEGDIPYIRKF